MSQPQRLFLTRDRDGKYMLTERMPAIVNIDGSDALAAYVMPGDRVGHRHMCPQMTHVLLGRKLRRLECVRVRVTIEEIGPEVVT